jgi:predicted nucleotidyltransferase
VVTRFLKGIEPFLVPMEALPEKIPSETYFLTRDLLFVFAEGYTHPPGGIYGKIIYHPHPDGIYDFYGSRYASTFKGPVNGRLALFSHRIQLEKQFKCDPSLDPTDELPVFAEHRVRFPLERFLGYFDHRRSLEILRERHPFVDRAIRELAVFLGRSEESIGATGSLAFGNVGEGEDLDLSFAGTVEENAEALRRIRRHTRDPANRVIEFGKLWPMRFFLNKVLICPFFLYAEEDEVPLRDMEVEVLAEGVSAEGRVGEDTHAIYFPPLMEMEEVVIDGRLRSRIPLILYDSSLRGEFARGDRLKLRGRLVDVRASGLKAEALLVTISEDIECVEGSGS